MKSARLVIVKHSSDAGEKTKTKRSELHECVRWCILKAGQMFRMIFYFFFPSFCRFFFLNSTRFKCVDCFLCVPIEFTFLTMSPRNFFVIALGAVVLIGLGVAQTSSWIIHFMEILNVNSHLARSRSFLRFHLTRPRLARFGFFPSLASLESRAIWNKQKDKNFYNGIKHLRFIFIFFSACSTFLGEFSELFPYNSLLFLSELEIEILCRFLGLCDSVDAARGDGECT